MALINQAENKNTIRRGFKVIVNPVSAVYYIFTALLAVRGSGKCFVENHYAAVVTKCRIRRCIFNYVTEVLFAVMHYVLCM